MKAKKERVNEMKKIKRTVVLEFTINYQKWSHESIHWGEMRYVVIDDVGVVIDHFATEEEALNFINDVDVIIDL